MNRILIAACVALIVAAAVVAYLTGGQGPAAAPALAPTPTARVELAPQAPLAAVAATAVAPPATNTPTEVPPAIAKQLAAVRANTPSRPMTQLAKSWFGCTSAADYNATLLLIRAKDPSSKNHFKGSGADCVPLTTGTHIKLLRLDQASGNAQISIDDTQQIVWTDSGALAGDPAVQ